MCEIAVRYNTSYDASCRASNDPGSTSPKVRDGTPSRLSITSISSVVTASPRLIVSPKMQNIHMLVENEEESKSTTSSVMDEQEESPSRGPSKGEQHDARTKRDTVLWAQAQAEVDVHNQPKVRAEAEELVRCQEAQGIAEARAQVQYQIGMQPRNELEIEQEMRQEGFPAAEQEEEKDNIAASLIEKGDAASPATIQRLEPQTDESRQEIQENSEKPETEKEEQKMESHSNEQRLEAQEAAVKIVQGIYDKINYREYANFLGAKENYEVLRKFIVLLEPLPNSLVLSLYKLVTRIYFIAEAQAIDRILEELSKGWVTANPETHWGNHYKLCHIVLFSLLILNSDLHNTENANNQTKFSKEEFIDNTLYAVSKEGSKSNFNLSKYEMEIRDELGIYYDALKYMSLPLLSRDEGKRDSRRRESRDYRDSKILLRRKNSKVSSRSQLGPNTENSSSEDDASSVFSGSSTSVKRESHYTSNWRFHNNKPLPALYHKESFDEAFRFSNNTLWCMDSGIEINERNLSSPTSDRSTTQRSNRFMPSSSGIFRWITRSKTKSLLHENRSPVAFFDGNTRWVKVRCRICEGRIYVFRTRSQCSGMQNSTDDAEDIKRTSDVYFVCSLYEAMAEVVQENVVVHNSHRPANHNRKSADNDAVHRGNFTVTIPAALHRKKTVLEFQTSNVEEAQKFVNCVNFWAARLTPVPTAQFEIVSNEENGWSPRLLSEKPSFTSLDRICLSSWKPLLSIGHLYSEQENDTEEIGMANKIAALQKFSEYLQQTIDSHNKVKPHMISVWRRTRNFDKAMDNWNKKYLYLNELNEKSSVYLYVLNMSLECLEQ